MSIINQIEINGTTYDLPSGGDAELYRWKYVSGTVAYKSGYNYNTKSIESASNEATCVYVSVNDISFVRISCETISQYMLGYCFVDASGNVLLKPQYVEPESFIDLVLSVPENATRLYVNGKSNVSPHIEVSAYDLMADIHTLPYLLDDLAEKIKYKKNFAWKPMPKGYVALTFDDSLGSILSAYETAHSKSVPICCSAIPERLNASVGNSTTIKEIMDLIVSDGGEVLAHGNEKVTSDNINDLNFLYNKFVVNKHKLRDAGYNVRGSIAVGGQGNIQRDSRTDSWMRLLFDYSDGYGINEPYYHWRVPYNNVIADIYEAVDECAENHTFLPVCFHGADSTVISTLIDYIESKGCEIVTYAYVYDTYGSDSETVSILNRISALENSNGNEVEY